jgi:23S rRNA (adenine2030-N6)-methyltransferase
MNYRHAYHAGGLLDLVKHLTLSHILKRLALKPAAFCVMDTHAAAGLYNLRGEEAQKTNEASIGAFAFLRLPEHPALAPLKDAIARHNPDGETRFYPGSPAIIRHFMRDDDRLIVIEKHAEEAEKLRRFLRGDPQVHLHLRDAFEAMKALLPVPEKRLLVFIDPPYEKPDEMDAAINAIRAAHARVSHGVYALWYPLKDVVATGQLHDRLAATGIPNILRADVAFSKDPLPGKVYGSGMILINPPYQLEDDLREAYAALKPLFGDGAPGAKVEWLRQ